MNDTCALFYHYGDEHNQCTCQNLWSANLERVICTLCDLLKKNSDSGRRPNGVEIVENEYSYYK